MMRKTIALLMTVVAVMAMIAGCAPSGAEPIAPSLPDEVPTSEPASAPEGTPAVTESEPEEDSVSIDVNELGTGEVPGEIFEAILADLSARVTLRAEDLTVVTAESVVWADGSLGCPEPDMMYTMATVNGYHVVLETPDGTFDYRVTQNGSFRLCENPPFVPVSPIDTGPPTE